MNPTSTTTIQVSVATATANANGQSIGDVSLILPEGLASALHDSVGTAVQSCNSVLTKLRRSNEHNTKRQASAGERSHSRGFFSRTFS